MYINKNEALALCQLIERHDTIIIHRHVRPDPDALGSQLGLKEIIEHSFTGKRVLAPGTVSKGLSWIGDMDEVTRDDYASALVIVCDTANQPRIDGDLFDQGQTLVKIDHHPVVDEYGDLQIVYPYASSTCELLVQLVNAAPGQFTLSNRAAQLLFTGMVSDTGRFLYNSTTSDTLLAASQLRRYDFDAYAISDHFMTMTMEEVKFQAFAFESLQFHPNGVASLLVTREVIAEYGITEEQTQSIVNLPGRVEGIVSWVIFVEQESNTPLYRCRIRSKGPIINQIAAQHDGGGHTMASGANAYSQEEMATIVKKLSDNAANYIQ